MAACFTASFWLTFIVTLLILQTEINYFLSVEYWKHNAVKLQYNECLQTVELYLLRWSFIVMKGNKTISQLKICFFFFKGSCIFMSWVTHWWFIILICMEALVHMLLLQQITSVKIGESGYYSCSVLTWVSLMSWEFVTLILYELCIMCWTYKNCSWTNDKHIYLSKASMYFRVHILQSSGSISCY